MINMGIDEKLLSFQVDDTDSSNNINEKIAPSQMIICRALELNLIDLTTPMNI